MKVKARFALGIEILEDANGKTDFTFTSDNKELPVEPIATMLEAFLENVKETYKNNFHAGKDISG